MPKQTASLGQKMRQQLSLILLQVLRLKSKIKSLPHQPGVYRMFDAEDNSLYVGKARHLARRVTSYTQSNRLSNRLMQMVALTRRLDYRYQFRSGSIAAGIKPDQTAQAAI